MPKPTGEEVATHYAAAHDRLAALAAGLDPQQLATAVPGTPGWDVHDVVAHLAAITTDALAGRLSGIPGDDVTARQVADRRGRTAAELLEEWAANVAPMCDGARAGLVPANLAVDALTHEQDIRGALGLAPALTAGELRFCLALYAFGLHRSLRATGLPALAVTATDSDFASTAGDGDPTVALRAPEFELFRALSGRRGRAQVLGYDWSGDPEPYLDRLNVFGALPATDVRDG